jgi:hypothetical protein
MAQLTYRDRRGEKYRGRETANRSGEIYRDRQMSAVCLCSVRETRIKVGATTGSRIAPLVPGCSEDKSWRS